MQTYSIPGFSDPVSSLSHLLGAGFFAVLAFFLLQRGANSWGRFVALGVFAFACVFQLSMSGVYHLLSHGNGAREVLRRLDHAAIFTLIAATFTPVHGILFHGWRRWLPLLVIWSAAATAISLKTVFFHSTPEWLGMALYLLMGWIGLFSGVLVWQRYGRSATALILAGGIAYTLGAAAEFVQWPIFIPGVIGPHELFHVAVLTGMGLFWAFIHQVAAGRLVRVP